MTKYKPLTTAHWYIQKLERKADQFDAIMSKKIKSFLIKVSEKTLWETLGDNYTIYHPWYFNRKETFEGKGCFPRAYLEHFIREHKSDLSSHKSTITKNGKIIKSVKGIRVTGIVDDLIRKFKITPPETGHLFGRGKAHRMHTEALIKWLKS
jgi:hypothetical protein